jgi:metal-responsive CopG/Arc/MetJ family transcriptional regulator
MTRTTRTPRIIPPIPVELLQELDSYRPDGQSRAEWIREAIRQRITRGTRTDPPEV